MQSEEVEEDRPSGGRETFRGHKSLGWGPPAPSGQERTSTWKAEAFPCPCVSTGGEAATGHAEGGDRLPERERGRGAPCCTHCGSRRRHVRKGPACAPPPAPSANPPPKPLASHWPRPCPTRRATDTHRDRQVGARTRRKASPRHASEPSTCMDYSGWIHAKDMETRADSCVRPQMGAALRQSRVRISRSPAAKATKTDVAEALSEAKNSG